METPRLLILGRILKPHGLRGELKVAVWSDTVAPFLGLAECWVGPRNGPYRPRPVEGVRGQGSGVILKLAGVETPEEAAALAGWEVAIPRAQAPEPPAGTFYHADLLGLLVVEEERPLGRVVEILETAAHDVFVIRGEAGEWMLPATRAHVRRIDPAAGRIEIQPASGLVESGSGGPASPEQL